MTGRFIGTIAALCVGAWLVNKAPSWSIVAVVVFLGAAWSLLAVNRRWERERHHRPLEPTKGRRR